MYWLTVREAITSGGSLPDRPFSQGLRDGQLLFISGQVAVDEQWETVGVGDFEEQARQVFENLTAVLQAANASFSHVTELTYYLVNMDDFSILDRVRREYLTETPYPASTAVEVARLLDRDWLLEVSAVALLPA
jgi:2-iminobutanoate/2-iminopropanoate deaminase